MNTKIKSKCATESNEDNYCDIDINISVKLPPFIPDDLEFWLQLVDICFKMAQVTNEETKFYNIVTALGSDIQHQDVIKEIRDLIIFPPLIKPYSALKAALIKELRSSQQRKTLKLLEREEMDDSKPSQFLHRLRELAGADVEESMLRTLWLGRLPQKIQSILETQKYSTLSELAELADAVTVLIRADADDINLNPKDMESSNMKDDLFKILVKETRSFIQQILHFLDQKCIEDDQLGNSASLLSPNSYRTPSRVRVGASDDICWYHRRFGVDARMCRKPCTYNAGGN